MLRLAWSYNGFEIETGVGVAKISAPITAGVQSMIENRVIIRKVICVSDCSLYFVCGTNLQIFALVRG